MFILLGGGYYLYDKGIIFNREAPVQSNNNETGGNGSTNNSTNESPWENPAEELSYLHSKANVVVGPLTQVKPDVYDTFPVGLKFLVPDDKQSQARSQSYSVTFNDGKKGFQAAYEYDAAFVTAYNYYQKLTVAKYNFLDGKKTINAAIYIVDDQAFTYFLDFLVAGEDKTRVTIVARPK